MVDAQEVLQVGSPDRMLPVRRRPGRRGTAAVVLVLVGLVGAGERLDHARERQELAGTLACAARAQAVLADARRATTTMAAYARPTLAVAAEPVQADLARLVGGAAARAVPELRALRATCRRPVPLPWHLAVRRTNAELERYLEGWTALLTATAEGRLWHASSVDVLATDLAAARRAALSVASSEQVAQVDTVLSDPIQP